MLAGGRGGFFFTSKHRKVAVLLLLGGEGFGVGRVRRAVCRIKATLNLRAVSSSSLFSRGMTAPEAKLDPPSEWSQCQMQDVGRTLSSEGEGGAVCCISNFGTSYSSHNFPLMFLVSEISNPGGRKH